MKTIAIIGAGQLGSRHLQSLANLVQTSNIYVIDPSEDARNTASQRYIEVTKSSKNVVHYFNHFNQLPSQVDLAIIATNSISRAKIIQALLMKCEIKNLILEKVLFPTLAEYDEIQNLLKEKGINTWVNCPRRSFDYYSYLKEEIKLPLTMQVEGSNWGLASNAIHFLDVFCYLIGDSSIELTHENLYDSIKESKRNGYIEFNGSLTFSSGENKIIITSLDNEPSLPLIKIKSSIDHYIIYESGPNPRIEKQINGEYQLEREIQIPFQSQMTSKIIEDIFELNTCSIPDYETSSKIHKIFLETLILKQRYIMKDDSIVLCPIT